MKMVVLCDFDGTVVLDDLLDELLARYAVPEYRQVAVKNSHQKGD